MIIIAIVIWLFICSPCNRKPLPVRLTDETSDPVIDIADNLVCQGLAKYITGHLLTSFSQFLSSLHTRKLRQGAVALSEGLFQSLGIAKRLVHRLDPCHLMP